MTVQSDLTINAVIRVPGVNLSRTTMEASLGSLDRFEASRMGGTYAQIGLPQESAWADVLAVVERIGPALQAYVERGEIERPSLDVALYIRDAHVTASLRVPNAVIVAVGRFGFDLDASVYLTGT